MSRPAAERSLSISLQAAVLFLVALALLAGIVPAGIAVDRWLAREVEARVWRDVQLAPAILADRDRAVSDALMMHAKDVAHTPALVTALGRGDRDAAVRIAERAARAMQRSPVLVDGSGAAWQGPQPPAALVQATRNGKMPVSVVSDASGLYVVSIAPVEQDGVWLGAAGVATPLDEAAAGSLAALTRSDLVVVFAADGHDVYSARLPEVEQLRRAIGEGRDGSGVREVRLNESRYVFTTAAFAGATVAFVRDLGRELGLLPQLRRVLTLNGAGALLLALLLGALLGIMLLRPVGVLAAAAERLAGGDFSAPLPSSSIRELAGVSRAFAGMRTALATRLEELRTANRLLEERQTRLTALQTELLRKERVAVSNRMVAELAHEIRNPVANLRNCLELIDRRLAHDPQGREYAALAIDELLRMHELAERMLDLNRPHSTSERSCNAVQVAEEVAALARVGARSALESVVIRGPPQARAAIGPDALKQVLLNLVQNARDAVPQDLRLELQVGTNGVSTTVDVCDNGPGIPVELRPQIFDAFFTTRSSAGGVGLGLYVVEGIVRSHGGTVAVHERAGGGACFRIVLPALVVPAPEPVHHNSEVS